MDAEIQPRYAGRGGDPAAIARALAVNPPDILLTVLAVGPAGRPVGHAALRSLGTDVEVKRVVVLAEARGHGVARRLMGYLEDFAKSKGIHRLILQTGDRQPDAVALYESLGYRRDPDLSAVHRCHPVLHVLREGAGPSEAVRFGVAPSAKFQLSQSG